MVLESRVKGSMVVVLTGFFNIKGDFSLNFFGHVLLLLVTKLANPPIVFLIICLSPGCSYVYHPVCMLLPSFSLIFFFFATSSLRSI